MSEHQLFTESLDMMMTSGTDNQERVLHRCMDTFLQDNPEGRVLATIYTHAGAKTGFICNSYSADGVTTLISPINEICDFNLGTNFMSQLKTRTAAKGLLLLACGPAMCTPHYPDVEQLVSKCGYSIILLLVSCMLTTVSATCLTLS